MYLEPIFSVLDKLRRTNPTDMASNSVSIVEYSTTSNHWISIAKHMNQFICHLYQIIWTMKLINDTKRSVKMWKNHSFIHFFVEDFRYQWGRDGLSQNLPVSHAADEMCSISSAYLNWVRRIDKLHKCIQAIFEHIVETIVW